MDFLVWIFAGGLALMSVLLVWLIIAYVRPAMQTCAKYFIQAKRNNKPIVALCDGSRWIFKVAKNTSPGLLIDDEGIPIEITPKSLMWGGGVLFGAGEYYRSKLANAKAVDFIAKVHEKGMTIEEAAELIQKIDDILNKEKGNVPKA